MTETELLLKLKKLLKRKKSKKYYCKNLGIDYDYFEKLYRKAKSELSGRNYEDLIKAHNIDTNKFRVRAYWSKESEDGNFVSSVLVSEIKEEEHRIEEFKKFLSTFKPLEKKFSDYVKDPSKEDVDIEVSISDYHLAKYTNDENNIDKRSEIFIKVACNLVEKVSRIYNIKKIVFPISNDFFHTDTYFNTTTNGTPQEVITTYDKEYEKGFETLANTITLLYDRCEEMEVILVQGNHDRTKGFYLAHALQIYFSKYGNISFKRDDSFTKHVVLGNTFIGYHHGDKIKIEELPLLFATSQETSLDFGSAKYREIHTGDKHHYMVKEIKGVRIHQMPSLCGTDRWHMQNNYVNQIRAALVLVYHPLKGKIMEIEERWPL